MVADTFLIKTKLPLLFIWDYNFFGEELFLIVMDFSSLRYFDVGYIIPLPKIFKFLIIIVYSDFIYIIVLSFPEAPICLLLLF